MSSVARPVSLPLCASAPDEAADRAKPTFDEIYSEQFDYVWRTARRLGVKPAEMDDVVQEIFITVHRLFHKYESGNLRGWLYAVAVNVVLHHHRKRRRIADSHAPLDDVEGVPDARERGPESSAATGQSLRLLEELLDRLDTDKRAVLVLAGIEQKSLAEIAAILDISPNTAASRLRAAREQIQQGLARHRARDRWRMK